MSGLSALRRSGRFMVMVSSPESRFWRTISFWLMAGSFVVFDWNGTQSPPSLRGAKRRSNPPFLLRRDGLLRFARNDEEASVLTSSPARSATIPATGTTRCRAARQFQRLERLGAGNRRQQLVVVPARLRFRRLLDLEQVHVVHHAAILAN